MPPLTPQKAGCCVVPPLLDLLMEQGAESFGIAQRPEVCCERAALLPGLGCYNGFVHTHLQYTHHAGVKAHSLSNITA